MRYLFSFSIQIAGLLIITTSPVSSQVNYIPNPDFHDINRCCEYRVHCAPEGWWTTSGGTFNFKKLEYDKQKMPVPRPAMFIAFDTRFTDCRSYIQAPLLCPLVKDHSYSLTVFIRPTAEAIDEIGILFSDTFLNIPKKYTYIVEADGFFREYMVDSLLPNKPQVIFKGNPYLRRAGRWISLTYNYKANGNEKFIIAGNFSPDSLQRRKKPFLKSASDGAVLYEIRKISLVPDDPSETCNTEMQYNILSRMNRRHTYFGTCEDSLPVNMNNIFMNVPAWRYTSGDQAEAYDFDSSGTPEEGRVYTLNNVLFDFDKASLQVVSYPVLDSLVDLLNEFPEFYITIFGHTDSMGSAEYNRILSTERAKAVASYLTDHGIDPERCRFHGFGADRPVALNNTEEGRRLNRRVEFILIKKQEND